MLKPFSLEEAFVLHSRPYKETSLIVELFTRNYGRVSVVAKGAKRPKSKISVIKTPFSLFLVSCSGKGDLKNLTNSEIKRYFNPNQHSLNSLVYLNELLMRLLDKEDPHVETFDNYLTFCSHLSSVGKKSLEAHLRMFELNLLKEIGYGVDLCFEANSDKKIKTDSIYIFDPMTGFQSTKTSVSKKNNFKGKDIINFSKGHLSDTETLTSSKQIMREAINSHLGNKPLKIREYLSR
tara:strand:- start:37 stop:744 length:708 start_codon:yes stop_codon:yes gene_type:complete